LVIFTIALIFKISPAAGSSIDEKERELAEIQTQIDKYNRLADQKAAEVSNLNSQLEALDGRIAATEAQIKATQLKIDKTQLQIEQTIEKIKQKNIELAYQKSVLDEALRVIYEEGNAGFLESFLTAETLTDLMDRTEYLDTVSNKIEVTMGKIEDIKADLLAYKKEKQDKKKELVDLRDEYSKKKFDLDNQRAGKNYLLTTTQGMQSRYESLMAKAQDSASSLSREIYEMRRRQSEESGEIIGGGSGGYPYAGLCYPGGPACPGYDPWNFCKCQCTGYAAWKRAANGRPFYNLGYMIGLRGHAMYWDDFASLNGYSWSYSPRVGDIAVWEQHQIGGGYGHVAIVEAVHGSKMDVSEYNYIQLSYSYRSNISWSGLKFIH